jgi:hypothetical protein
LAGDSPAGDAPFLIHAGKALLVLPVSPGIQPGTISNVLSAPATRV